MHGERRDPEDSGPWKSEAHGRCSMEKKIDAVKLMRDIRAKLGEKYAKSQKDELRELKEKFGHLRKKKDVAHAK